MALQTSPAFASMLQLFNWAKRPLQYVTCYVNTLRITPTEALEGVRVELARQAARLGRATPSAEFHPLLRDTIIISAWPGCKPLMEPPPDRPKYPRVVVDFPCGVGVAHGAHIYNSGVMAISENASVGDTVSVEVFKEGFRQWIAYGKLLMLPLTRKEGASRDDLRNNCVVEITEGISVLPQLPSDMIRQGLLCVQSLPASLTSHALNPQPGERILCTGCIVVPLHVGTLSDNKADIVAIHRSASKIRVLNERSKTMGVKVTGIATKTEDFVKTLVPGQFDCVVAKPNMSSYGGRPCIGEDFFLEFSSNYQARFYFGSVLRAVKPGGRIVLFLGSAAPLESDGFLRWLLDNHNVKLVAAEPRLTPVAVQSPPIPVPSWMKLSVEEERLIQRFGPQIQGTEADPVSLDASLALIACLIKTH